MKLDDMAIKQFAQGCQAGNRVEFTQYLSRTHIKKQIVL